VINKSFKQDILNSSRAGYCYTATGHAYGTHLLTWRVRVILISAPFLLTSKTARFPLDLWHMEANYYVSTLWIQWDIKKPKQVSYLLGTVFGMCMAKTKQNMIKLNTKISEIYPDKFLPPSSLAAMGENNRGTASNSSRVRRIINEKTTVDLVTGKLTWVDSLDVMGSLSKRWCWSFKKFLFTPNQSCFLFFLFQKAMVSGVSRKHTQKFIVDKDQCLSRSSRSSSTRW